MVQILKDDEVITEIESADDSGMLKRAQLRAELLDRDNDDGTYSARIKPKEVEEVE